VSNSNKTITKRQQTNLENAKRWLRRARMDFNAFRRMVPFDKKSRKPVRCTDPALAVYLLQQTTEKATKAVAAATGKYSYSKLKRLRHNSLNVLLDFCQQIINAITEQPELNAIGIGFGLDLNEGLNKITNLMSEVKKTPRERKAGEVLYREQLAEASDAGIAKALDLLLLIRGEAYIGVPRSIFKPHSKIVIDKRRLNMDTPEDLVNSFLQEAEKQLNIPQISESQVNYLEDIVKLLAPDGIIDDDKEEKKIVVERPTKDQLGQWSLVALLILAMYTFPHESTTRYPGPSAKKATSTPNGYEDYNASLGIVSQLGRMGYITMLALNELEPELETIAGFYPTVEASSQ